MALRACASVLSEAVVGVAPPNPSQSAPKNAMFGTARMHQQTLMAIAAATRLVCTALWRSVPG